MSASTVRPVTIRSNARDAPMSRGSRYVTPMSVPVSPVLMNAEQNVADRAATRRSHANDSESPPPNAGPLTAAITIWGVARMCCVRFAMKDWPVVPTGKCGCSPADGGVPKSFRSRPAQNPRPAPVRTATLHVGVRGDRVERVVKIGDEFEGDRVEAIGAVEPDDADGVARMFEEDGGHRSRFGVRRGRRSRPGWSPSPR